MRLRTWIIEKLVFVYFFCSPLVFLPKANWASFYIFLYFNEKVFHFESGDNKNVRYWFCDVQIFFFFVRFFPFILIENLCHSEKEGANIWFPVKRCSELVWALFAIYQSLEIQYAQKYVNFYILKVLLHHLFEAFKQNTFSTNTLHLFMFDLLTFGIFVNPQHAIKTFIFRKPSINGVHFPAKVTATNIRIVTNSFWYHAHFFPSIQRHNCQRSLWLDDDYYITIHWKVVYKHFLCKVISDWWLRPCHSKE